MTCINTSSGGGIYPNPALDTIETSSSSSSMLQGVGSSSLDLVRKMADFCVEQFNSYKTKCLSFLPSNFLTAKSVCHQHAACSLVPPYILARHQLFFEEKVAKNREIYGKLEQVETELQLFKRDLKEQIKIGPVEITDEQIAKIKEAITQIIALLKKLAEKQKAREDEKPVDLNQLAKLEKDWRKDKFEVDTIKTAITEYRTHLTRIKDKIEKAKEGLENLRGQQSFNEEHLKGCEAQSATLIEKGIQRIKEEASKVIHALKDRIHPSEQQLEKQEFPAAVYNARHRRWLPGKRVYDNFSDKYDFKTLEEAAKTAYANSFNVLTFWWDVFQIHSYDNMSKRIDAVIHFMRNYVNAFFNGEQMVYGDGNKYFAPFWKFLEIAGHEMGHALVGNKLEYYAEAGALNEHFADVLGACADMHTKQIPMTDYHWEVGHNLVTYKGFSYPLRTFKEGLAYEKVPVLGTDLQPQDYEGVLAMQKDPQFAEILRQDNEGVHLFSKIPNRVFFMICELSEDWKEPLLFWMRSLDRINNPQATFADFAAFQIKLAQEENNEELATWLVSCWTKVKVPFDKASLDLPRESIDIRNEEPVAV